MHALLTLAILLYAVVWGQNWTHYAAAVMLWLVWRDWAEKKKLEEVGP